ncbi:MAG: hypothetical protein MK008_08450, partial [Bdellovibrionales bacterium]|nr:hypothetical protein [Bdellovibrionales bacterium]
MRKWFFQLMAFSLLVLISGCTASFKSIQFSQASLALESYQSVGMYLGQGKSLNFNPPSFSKTNQKSSNTEEMTYSCHYDQAVDEVVNSSNNCSELANFSFSENSGQMQWSPTLSQEGVYEFQVDIAFKKKKYTKIFEINLKKQPLFSMNNDSGYEKGDSEIEIIFDNILNEGEKVALYGDEKCSQWLGELVAASSSENFRKLQTKSLNYGTYKIHAKARSGKAQFPCLDTGIVYEYTAPSPLVDVIPATSVDIFIKESGEKIFIRNILGFMRSVAASGGDLPPINVPQYEYLDTVKVVENIGAIVLLKSSGSVVAYGKANFGGDTSAVQGEISSGVVDIFSTGILDPTISVLAGPNASILATKEDGSFVCWGYAAYCDTSGVDFSSGLKKIYPSAGAFVVEKNNGEIVAWGDASFGGDISGVDLSGGVKSIITSGSAYAAIKNDDSVICWGDASTGGNCGAVDFSSGVKKLIPGVIGMSALKNNNDLVSWGFDAGPTISNVDKVQSGFGAMAVLKFDGTAMSWGDENYGGSLGGTDPAGVSDLLSLGTAFILLMDDGSVQTSTNIATHFANSIGSEINSNIVSMEKNTTGVIFQRDDGVILSYALQDLFGTQLTGLYQNKVSGMQSVFKTTLGGYVVKDQDDKVHFLNRFDVIDKYPISNFLNNDIKDIKLLNSSIQKSYAILLNSGTVITTRNNNKELYEPTELSSSVDQIFSTTGFALDTSGFSALKNDGSVYSWGYFVDAETFSAFEALPAGAGVQKIVSTSGAFAALLNDGSVVSWGDNALGGDSSAITALDSGVDDVFSNSRAFAALKDDGSVVTWGASSSGGDSSAADFTGGVKKIFSTHQNFVALKNDDSLTSWGYYESIPGDKNFNDVSTQLTNVMDVYSNLGAYFALKADGSLVTWGGADAGGNSDSVSASL